MTVLPGVDVLLAEQKTLLARRRLGLVTNPGGVTRALVHTLDALRAAGANVAALFSPEHGLSGAAGPGEPVAPGRDARTGLPIHSLYGETRRPAPAMLAELDLLLFDLQDVGARFYTYTTTLALVMVACAEAHLPLVVLDRPNPINGLTVEGPRLDPTLQSFVGHGPLPIRSGLTIGELGRFYNRQLRIGAELQVIAMRGWRREMWWDETGLAWVPPSPNMPHLSTATVYPGTCLLEGTNLSVGRGTSLPFELAGAPWIDGYALAEALSALNLAGVRFRAAAFRPAASRFAGAQCYGVQLHVTGREAFRPVTAALHLLDTVKSSYPAQFEWQAAHFDRLAGDAGVRDKIQRGVAISRLEADWTADQQDFVQKRTACLLYA